ncbi:hypothetical protein EXN66_Car016800 [Channa argus]|uniref:Secreted protein n=1 Tax=Channa argus TaxID=215402 RepID=A0A6G1QEY0_CHAAH|nr:hypothetical protein EXN66_Car016800 [Channa argus]
MLWLCVSVAFHKVVMCTWIFQFLLLPGCKHTDGSVTGMCYCIIRNDFVKSTVAKEHNDLLLCVRADCIRDPPGKPDPCEITFKTTCMCLILQADNKATG